MADPNVGERVASTYESTFGSNPTDNIFPSMQLFAGLGEKGLKKNQKGGRLFGAGIEYATNTTMQMVGEFDMLDITRISTFDEARYDQKICGGTVSYSYLEMAQNQGSDLAKFDLIADRIENGRKSAMLTMNQQSWNNSAAGTNDLTSIPTIVSATPTTGTVGGINAATYTWWRNRQNSGAKTAAAYDNLVYAMELTFNQCTLGGLKMAPTVAYTDITIYTAYEQVMNARLRYTVDVLAQKGDTAFANSAIRFKGINLLFDEDLASPGARVYFLNNEVLKFEYLANNFLKLDPAVDPANQLMNVHKLYTMGNWVCAARRHLGVVTSIT